MAMIYVRTKPGRVAMTDDGRPIPHDKYVPVAETPYIRRLIDHHHDIEVQGHSPSRAPAHEEPAPAPRRAPPPTPKAE